MCMIVMVVIASKQELQWEETNALYESFMIVLSSGTIQTRWTNIYFVLVF
jgi:hypothetical protein